MRLAFAYALVLLVLGASFADDPRYAQPQPGGALSGKRIYLSPGHGYYYDTTYGWTTQRGVTYGLIEDTHTLEIVSDYLAKYLYNAGATAYVCRERDKQTEEHIVVNTSAGYSETGTWTTTANAGTGYGGGSYRYASASPSETATARWTATFNNAGYYSIYVWYKAYSDRVSDATYRVNHSGGTTVVRMNQQINSSRWLWLGEYWFDANTTGSLELSNQSAQSGVVIADAARFGGGMGSIVRGGTTSGQPRWKECAYYWLDFMGAPSSVYQTRSTDRDSDVTCRPHYADWQGGDAYFSLHTNAGGGTGTSSYIYNGTPSAGSAALQRAIHTQVISDIRAGWDASWTDRGMLSADFGEVRECTTMPAVLLELAFHDLQTPDNADLHDDRYRELSARAIYKGIARYFDANATILPLAPKDFRVQNLGGGSARLSWRQALDPIEPSATPTGYRVYMGRNGKGFQDGVAVSSNATDVTYDVSGLTPGQVYYFKVSATNAGGESFPTATLALRAGPRAQVLIVESYTRLDQTVTYRDGQNTFDYVRWHALAIVAAGTVAPGGQAVYFDSAMKDAVQDGLVSLSAYNVIDWLLGLESSADRTFTSAEQSAVSAYLAGGGALLVTGANVAYDLGSQGSASDQAFLSGTLHATYVAAATAGPMDGAAGAAFAGDSGLQYGATYTLSTPDAVSPATGGVTSLLHRSTGQTAGVQYAGTGRVLYLSIPIESFRQVDAATVMTQGLTFLFQTSSGSRRKELMLGLGSGAYGYYPVMDASRNAVERWRQLPWSAYDQAVGETRIACGDVDGDGLDDFVVGLGSYPSSGGFVEVVGDAQTGYAHLAWLRYAFAAYNAANGETNVACADLDGDGKAEIVVGPGAYPSAGGWFEVFGDAGMGYRHLTWLRVPDTSYDAADGRVYPACGTVDGSGTGSIVVGLGPYPANGGRLFVFGGPSRGWAQIGTLQLPWSAYNAANGETRPALADLDGDGRSEVLVGTGTYTSAGGWVWVADDAVGNYATRGWTRLGWQAYDAADGQVWVAAGDASGDGSVKVALGSGPYAGNGGWVELRGGLSSNFPHLGWLNAGWQTYNSANGSTRPAFGQVH